jgi:hypothetical protein
MRVEISAWLNLASRNITIEVEEEFMFPGGALLALDRAYVQAIRQIKAALGEVENGS